MRKKSNYAEELERHLGSRADLGAALLEVLKDPDVPLAAKHVAVAAAKYEVENVDLIPDDVPIYGALDDVFVSAIVLDSLTAVDGFDSARFLARQLDSGISLGEHLLRMKQYVHGFWHYCKDACAPFMDGMQAYFREHPEELPDLVAAYERKLEEIRRELADSPPKLDAGEAERFVAQFRKMVVD